jgi:hypothetical protein
MPYESLTCPNCGSGDCQEVKPGTHFCNYCDNVFRHVSPGKEADVIGCGLKLDSGKACALPPIGRCRTCGEPFCGSHQARVGEVLTHYSEDRFVMGSPYPDWCSPCRTAELVTPILERKQRAAEAEAEQRHVRQEQRKSAPAALGAYGFEKLAKPRTETYKVFEARSFGRDRWLERSRSLEPAVPIGDLRWRISGMEYHYRDGIRVDKDVFLPTGITESDQIVLMNPNDAGGGDLRTEFDGHASVGEALWNVLSKHGVHQAGS